MPDTASVPLKPTVTGDFRQPAALLAGLTVAYTVGGDASRLMVIDLLADPPELVAVHVKARPALSVVIERAPQPVRAVIADSGSCTFHATATSLTYQPFLPSAPDTSGVMSGGVVSATTL
jgi:hypothetical protein